MSLDDIYKQYTDIEHVLANPAMYLGSIAPVSKHVWIYDEGKIILEEISLHEALYKLLDEALTNMYDHCVRCQSTSVPVTTIKVKLDSTSVSFHNDGKGIDVAKHSSTGLYIPHLIFGCMRTSTNYGDKTRVTGGRHGLGVKLAVIWSKRARVDIIDQERKLAYTQWFFNNLGDAQEPTIKSVKRELKSGATTIYFEPDFEKFGLTKFPDYIEKILLKRIYDLSILLPQVKFYFNDKLVPKRGLKNYFLAYFPSSKYAYLEQENWNIAVALSSSGFTCMSLVNGIHTFQGGIHVNLVLTKLISALQVLFKEKKKLAVQSRIIRDHLSLIVTVNVIDAEFTGQIKETLCAGTFCSILELSPAFIDAVYKLIGTTICGQINTAQIAKKDRELKKLLAGTDGTGRQSRVQGVPELTDANWAGTKSSKKCCLIICEGESSATGILSGLSSEQRNIYGIYPVRGKPMNPRNRSMDMVAKDKIITDLKKVLGLEAGKVYTTPDRLRYGRVIFMTDQDLDGHHIKGLGINLFDYLWPSLVKLDNFLGFIQTPIIRARKGSKEVTFFYDQEYKAWKERAGTGWTFKYYKGLGTSTEREFKEYFKHPREIYFSFTPACKQSIEMAFGKDSDSRKQWLAQYNPENAIKIENNSLTYSDFIHKELIHFSKYDCARSLSALDGLKISQRKILYVAFSMLKQKEIKVAQFCGNVAQKTHYKHGEVSLEKAIIGMAQNFVGSNNFNLLLPHGQFGSRKQGGEDHASARYLFTELNPLSRLIFREEDDPILDYAEDDGYTVEPKIYAPIIPMILVNGSLGIGTGFSSLILPHNIVRVIECMRAVIEKRDPPLCFPSYRGFTGELVARAGGYVSIGSFQAITSTKIKVVELPVGFWTRAFKELLENLIVQQVIKSYIDCSTDKDVLFEIDLTKELTSTEIVSTFKLEKKHHETNMYLFDYNDQLRKYDNARAILEDYYPVRLNYYTKRKEYMIQALARDILIEKNKVKYVKEIAQGVLTVFKPKDDLVQQLTTRGFDLCDGTYSYLLRMPIHSLCADNIESLCANYLNLENKLNALKGTSEQAMWLSELDELERALVRERA